MGGHMFASSRTVLRCSAGAAAVCQYTCTIGKRAQVAVTFGYKVPDSSARRVALCKAADGSAGLGSKALGLKDWRVRDGE